MGGHEIGIPLEHLFEGRDRLVTPPGQVIGVTQRPQIEERILGIESHRLLDVSDGLVCSLGPREDFRQGLVAVSIVGGQRDGSLRLGDRPLVLFLPEIDLGQQVMRARERVVDHGATERRKEAGASARDRPALVAHDGVDDQRRRHSAQEVGPAAPERLENWS